MKVRLLALIGLFLGALSTHGQPPEIVQAVSQDKARRLEEANRVFLMDQLYAAARYRIVSINTAPLLQDQAIAITPFPDMTPIVLMAEQVRRTDNSVAWFGRIQTDDPVLERSGLNVDTLITMFWWDVDDLGVASPSDSNRFKFSPAWKIDANDQPVLIPQGVAEPGEVGPAPRTPEEIAEHKRLLQLHRHAFGAVTARLELLTGQTYVVSPLRYTPKYAVVYEMDKDKVPFIPFEEDELGTATIQQRESFERYDAFRRSLPIENKPILGDVE